MFDRVPVSQIFVGQHRRLGDVSDRHVSSRRPQLADRALALGEHVDNLGPTAAAQCLRDRCEGVEQGRLSTYTSHIFKLSLEYLESKAPRARRAQIEAAGDRAALEAQTSRRGNDDGC